nr:MAG TPA: hypothetical protein [Caudoviricetes sp.]
MKQRVYIWIAVGIALLLPFVFLYRKRLSFHCQAHNKVFPSFLNTMGFCQSRILQLISSFLPYLYFKLIYKFSSNIAICFNLLFH